MNASRSWPDRVDSEVPGARPAARTAARAAAAEETARAKVASAMAGTATPSSRAVCVVHTPVPFCPAASTTTSTKGRPVAGSVRESTSVVMSMR